MLKVNDLISKIPDIRTYVENQVKMNLISKVNKTIINQVGGEKLINVLSNIGGSQIKTYIHENIKTI